MSDRHSPYVLAIVPFGDFGSDELLVLPEAGGFRLPTGRLLPGERVLAAARRIVLEVTGLPVDAERLLYVVEGADGEVAFGVLCTMPDSGDESGELAGEIASLAGLGEQFEPVALHEVLLEDLRSGCVRPVAHIIEGAAGDRRSVHVSW